MGWDGLNDIGWLWWWTSKKGWVCFFLCILLNNLLLNQSVFFYQIYRRWQNCSDYDQDILDIWKPEQPSECLRSPPVLTLADPADNTEADRLSFPMDFPHIRLNHCIGLLDWAGAIITFTINIAIEITSRLSYMVYWHSYWSSLSSKRLPKSS